ncbi:MAG TPA: hypothetical protein VEC16_06220 [Alphaproteobacteria bacterium]|nr:hypothetical protein [Alphaproteobacteria bacterium]
MDKRVYIEDVEINGKNNSSELIFPLDPSENISPKKFEEHIFDIKTPEQEVALIDYLHKKEYVGDQELVEYIDAEAPELVKYFHSSPIPTEEFKEQMRMMFGDIPEYLFEGENNFVVINKIINHLLKKEAVGFVLKGISEGTLIYDEEYYPAIYASYYRIAKFNFRMDSYHMAIELWEMFLENHYWKVMFSDKDDITRNYLREIREVYNFLGKQYTDFIELLTKQKVNLNNDITWIKRTTIKTMPYYYDEATKADNHLTDAINKLKKQRENLYSRKAEIEKLLDSKNAIRKEEIDTILSGKFGIIKLGIKKLFGVL